MSECLEDTEHSLVKGPAEAEARVELRLSPSDGKQLTLECSCKLQDETLERPL